MRGPAVHSSQLSKWGISLRRMRFLKEDTNSLKEKRTKLPVVRFDGLANLDVGWRFSFPFGCPVV